MTWETVPLGEVAQLNPRGNSDARSATFLGMADLGEDGTTGRGIAISPAELKAGYTPFRDSDLLVAKITPCFENGKIGQASISTEYGWGSTEFHVVRPDDARVDRRFLLHFLRSPAVRANGEMRMTGSAGQKRVPIDFFRNLGVPLPPLAEQRRIAGILDDADALRSRQAALSAGVVGLAEAAFRRMEVRLPDGASVRLDSLADVSSGITKGRKAPTEPLTATDYMTVANVQDRRLDLTAVKQIEVSDKEVERYRVVRGDLLLTEGGDPDKLGRGVVWSDELPLAIHQNHVFRVRLRTTEHSPTWLNWEIGSNYGKRYFLRAAKQTTGIATINSSQLRAFPVRVPPRDDVLRFMDELAEVQTLRTAIERRTQLLDSLFASLQHRAFRGEL